MVEELDIYIKEEGDLGLHSTCCHVHCLEQEELIVCFRMRVSNWRRSQNRRTYIDQIRVLGENEVEIKCLQCE